MANADALFGIGVGDATSAMRVAYGGHDGTSLFKPVHPGTSPPNPLPYYHHQSATGGGSLSGGEVPSPGAAYGRLNMNVVVEGGSEQQQQQHPPMMMKKKRGRPRKYGEGLLVGRGGTSTPQEQFPHPPPLVGGTDGNMSLALMPSTTNATAASGAPPQAATTAGGAAFSPPTGGGVSSPSSSFKKARGRPPGSTNKTKKSDNKHHQQIQPLQFGSAGFGFTPHVISVKAGEDVSSKIMSFSQNGPRAVCILSANGSISNVTLRQAATSGGTATYEGRFEILSLCGSFLLTEVGGQRSRTGRLSISLAGPDGRVLGGCVAGLLTAASPVQVIVGSFNPDGRRETKAAASQVEPTQQHLSSPPPPHNPMPMPMQPMLFSPGGGGLSGNSPTSDGGGSFSESSSGGEGGSPTNYTTGGAASNHHHHHNNHHNGQGMVGIPWR